jgi:hypothetical protein
MTTLAAASPSSPSPTSSSSSQNAAPVPDSVMSMSRRNLIIILAVVIGLLIATTVSFIMYGCRKKTTRVRFLGRAVTPLSDSEFDQWRRPGKGPQAYKSAGTTVYKTTGIRYEADVKAPSPICHVVRIDPKAQNMPQRPVSPPVQAQALLPSLMHSPSTSTRPLIRSMSTITTTSTPRHKSSMSLQDRPPTPYSPSTPPSGWDDELLFSEVPQSPRQREHRVHVHYPSVSEASDFDFGFGYGPPDSPRRESTRRESWVHHSRRFSSLGQGHPSFQGFNLPDSEAFKKNDFD